jgi:hypothetical protein
MKIERSSHRGRWIWVLAVALGLLHHDFWFWSDRRLIFGFLPVGLGYHMLFSLLTAGLWALALRFAWPAELEAWADQTPPPAPQKEGGAGA